MSAPTSRWVVGYLTRPWRLLREPRVVSALWVLIYLVATVVGIAQTQEPGLPVMEPAGTQVAYGSAIAMAIGGVLALAAVLPGWWGVERGGVLLVMSGIAVRMLTIPATSDTLAEAIVRGGINVIAALALVIRLIHIWGLDLDPTRG